MPTLPKLTYCRDVTDRAHTLVPVKPHTPESSFPPVLHRSVLPETIFDLRYWKKPLALSLYDLKMGAKEFNLSALSQLVDRSQTRFITEAIFLLARLGKVEEIKELVDSLIQAWEKELLSGEVRDDGFLAGIRPVDLGMVVNRIRGIQVHTRKRVLRTMKYGDVDS
jgi:hypothetical protein